MNGRKEQVSRSLGLWSSIEPESETGSIFSWSTRLPTDSTMALALQKALLLAFTPSPPPPPPAHLAPPAALPAGDNTAHLGDLLASLLIAIIALTAVCAALGAYSRRARDGGSVYQAA